jgi:FMN-dependent oxidoreductase (nitrilotriacetate monooxygenase family)
MPQSTRKLHFNLFLAPGGHHEAGWRHKDASPHRSLDLKYYVDIVRSCEAAKLDAVFLGDGPVLANNIKYAARVRIEPFTWLSAFAAVTDRIGLIGTASTTYNAPYNLARQFASLDHLSKGRAGWNIVTTGQPEAAQNFGLPTHPVHAERYDMAHEFMDVVTKLWDSWEDDALVADAVSGVHADTMKIHPIHHVGKHLRVRGPLNSPRSPQGRPVYVQAGSSDDGRVFATRYAEAIFCAQNVLSTAQDFYAEMKRRVAEHGRNPEHVKIMPGVTTYIGSTQREAERLQEELNDLTQREHSIAEMRRRTGIDLTDHDFDGPFPRELLTMEGDGAQHGRFKVLLDIIDREKPTIRKLLHKMAGARGHWNVVGTPEGVANEIQAWFENGAADGFNLMPTHLTGGFDAFFDEVLPMLRRRGLFREDYEGVTLRDHLGLPRPESQYRGAEITA